jgi:hypothetical protein
LCGYAPQPCQDGRSSALRVAHIRSTSEKVLTDNGYGDLGVLGLRKGLLRMKTHEKFLKKPNIRAKAWDNNRDTRTIRHPPDTIVSYTQI